LFAGVPDRTRLQRLLVTHQDWNKRFLADPSFFLVIDSYPMISPKLVGRLPDPPALAADRKRRTIPEQMMIYNHKLSEAQLDQRSYQAPACNVA
jgi:hypothetical protein